MKIITVDNLKEGDILAKDVLLPDYTVLLGKGTEIKLEYIEKLREYFIVTVYIEEKVLKNTSEITVEENKNEESEADNVEAVPEIEVEYKKEYILKNSSEELEKLKEEIEAKINSKVKEILEPHSYKNNYGLDELAKNTGYIIQELLKEPAIVDKVYDVKERGADIYEHSLTTATLAILVALKLNYPEEDIKDIGVSALLHDLGLRYLTVKYENRDINLLTKNEQIEYKKHGLYAYTSIKDETWISERSKEMILNHHEKKDGSGYPLKKPITEKECQVLGLCDEFDEMICGIGKAKIRVHEAISCIRNYNGVWFDSEIVDAFLDLVAVYPVGTKVRTNKDQIGIVIRQNHHFPERPVIRILEDKYNKNMLEELTINLIDDTKIVIEEVLK